MVTTYTLALRNGGDLIAILIRFFQVFSEISEIVLCAFSEIS